MITVSAFYYNLVRFGPHLSENEATNSPLFVPKLKFQFNLPARAAAILPAKSVLGVES